MRIVVQLVIAVMTISCCLPPGAYAGRPLSTDDAGTVAPGQLQIETAAEHLRESTRDKETSVSVNLTTGVIWERLDFAVGVPYLWWDPAASPSHNGFGDLQTRLKLRFVDETDKIPALAVTAGIKPDTGDCDKGLGSGTTDFIGNFIASKGFGKLTIHANAGYNASGDLPEEITYDFVNLGLAGEYAVTGKFSLAGEIYAELAIEDTGEENPAFVLAGGRYILPGEIILDCGIAIGLTDGAPDYRVTGGFTYVF